MGADKFFPPSPESKAEEQAPSQSIEMAGLKVPDIAGNGSASPDQGAVTSEANSAALCPPSQKGLFLLWPQRHRNTDLPASVVKALPAESQIWKSPSIFNGPFFREESLVLMGKPFWFGMVH